MVVWTENSNVENPSQAQVLLHAHKSGQGDRNVCAVSIDWQNRSMLEYHFR